MKTNLLKIAVIAIVLLVGIKVRAQAPLHQPVTTYTNDNHHNRPGHASTIIPLGDGGRMEETVGGIQASNSAHYICQNISRTDAKNIVLEKRNASTGASQKVIYFNIGQYRGLRTSVDKCRGILLDESLNRVYVYGKTGNSAFIFCYDMTNLYPVLSFGVNGIAIIETNAEMTGMTLTGDSNNFVVTLNKSNGTITLREYNSNLNAVASGVISLPNYTCTSSYSTLKRGPNGRYYIAGKAKNSSGSSTPMIWDYKKSSSTTLSYVNSTSPHPSGVGYGNFMDFDFYPVGGSRSNTSEMKFGRVQFYIVAVGNTDGTIRRGIYAKYPIAYSNNYYSPISNFTNMTSLPGRAYPSNSNTPKLRFTRCVVGNNGYITVLAHNNSFDGAVVGYLNPEGTRYFTTYFAPASPYTHGVHKANGLEKDKYGNVLVSGCNMSELLSIIKLSDSYNYIPVYTGPKIGNTTTVEELKVVPNPTKGIFNINWDASSTFNIEVYNQFGARVLAKQNLNNSTAIDISNQASGVYLIKILSDEGDVMTKKIVKK